MWQITWMLSLLPDWFWALILIAGIIGIIAGFFFKFIPFVGSYSLPIKIVSVILLLIGVYFQGVIANEEKWQARVKELEEKLAKAEEESKKENVRIEEKIVYKDRIIKEKAQTQIKYIEKLVKGDTVEITKDMSEEERKKFLEKQKELEYALANCPVPRLVIEEHNKATINDAAKGPKGEKK